MDESLCENPKISLEFLASIKECIRLPGVCAKLKLLFAEITLKFLATPRLDPPSLEVERQGLGLEPPQALREAVEAFKATVAPPPRSPISRALVSESALGKSYRENRRGRGGQEFRRR